MAIRELKDIPTVMRTIQIQQPDYTEEERVFYEKENAKKICEMNARANGQDFKWVKDEKGYDHFLIENKETILEKLLGFKANFRKMDIAGSLP